MIHLRFSNEPEKLDLMEAVNKGELKNILMFRCQKLGDMLTFLPTLLCIKNIFPSAQLTLACRKEGLVIAERIPNINTVLVDDLKKKGPNEPKYDLMITSSQDAGLIKLKKSLGVKFAIGIISESPEGVCLKHRWEYRYFTAVERYTDNEHDVDRNMKVLRLLGKSDCEDMERSLWITPSEQQALSSLIADTPTPLVVVSPSGSKQSKNWRPDYFAELCDQLIRERGVGIVIAGKGKLAMEQSERILLMMNEPALSIVNKTSFGVLCALIERADLLISVDSGTAHIASYLNRPLAVIFGPGDFQQWKPWHKDKTLGAVLKATCKCGTTLLKCRENVHCLDSIKPGEVFKAAVQVLDKSERLRKKRHDAI